MSALLLDWVASLGLPKPVSLERDLSNGMVLGRVLVAMGVAPEELLDALTDKSSVGDPHTHLPGAPPARWEPQWRMVPWDPDCFVHACCVKHCTGVPLRSGWGGVGSWGLGSCVRGGLMSCGDTYQPTDTAVATPPSCAPPHPPRHAAPQPFS
jgi:hypothetical protein